jgi:hypothetical protein
MVPDGKLRSGFATTLAIDHDALPSMSEVSGAAPTSPPPALNALTGALDPHSVRVTFPAPAGVPSGFSAWFEMVEAMHQLRSGDWSSRRVSALLACQELRWPTKFA